MKELYKEVCDYITSHNGVSDNLYNGILLKIYEEYACNYLENETMVADKEGQKCH